MKDHRHVSTWITESDFDMLQKIAKDNNVTIATYLRGIVVDAIQDEISINSYNSDISPHTTG
jgi:hypothetical protein